MTNLTPNPNWSDVPQVDTTTQVLGGPGGPINAQAQALLNRTEILNPANTSAPVAALDGTETWSFKKAGNWFQAQLSSIANYVLAIFTLVWVAGTGGVARALVAKIKDLPLNVVDFGADSTGVASSKAAFQAALVAQALTGKVIFIPAGNYKIDGQLLYTAPVKLTGEGIDDTKLICTFIGGPTLMPSGTNCHMPGTCIEKLYALGPGNATGTGEYFYQSQTFEANRNGIFRDLHIDTWDKAGLIVSDSYDNVFDNLRLWNIGDTATYGWGILLDRQTWNNQNCNASTGNHYENISCMHIYRGIGVTAGNEVIDSMFSRITGEFCDGTIETYSGATAPPNGWKGNNVFIRVYSEQNTSFGIKSINGSEIECFKYTSGGNNNSIFNGPFVRTNNGQLAIGNSASGAIPSLQLLKLDGSTASQIAYNNALFKTQLLASNGVSCFSFYDGVLGGGSSYAQIIDPANIARAQLFFGSGTSAFVDYGLTYSSYFSFSKPLALPQGYLLQSGGSAARTGTATLVSGVVTISTTALGNSSRVFVSMKTPSGTVGYHYADSADFSIGVSFKIRSTSASDNSVVNWVIIDSGA